MVRAVAMEERAKAQGVLSAAVSLPFGRPAHARPPFSDAGRVPARAPPMILLNRHVLAVPDARKTARFFVDVLGFRVVNEPPGWVFVARDGCMVMLGSCPDAIPPRELGDHAWFGSMLVDDADALHAEWAPKGGDAIGRIEDKPWGTREFTVRTPDGHALSVGHVLRPPSRALEPETFARSWLAAFNAGDVDAIMAHYAEGVEHSSPTVARLLGEPSGVVRGKDALRAYFVKALVAAGPGLRYDMQRLYVGAHGVTLLYHRSGGKLVAETFQLDARGLVARAFVAHAP